MAEVRVNSHKLQCFPVVLMAGYITNRKKFHRNLLKEEFEVKVCYWRIPLEGTPEKSDFTELTDLRYVNNKHGDTQEG